MERSDACGQPIHQPVRLTSMYLSALSFLLLLTYATCQGQDFSATFETQLPSAPGIYDAHAHSQTTCSIPVSPLEIKWREPSAGVTSQTGVILILPGQHEIFDCVRPFDVQDAAWPNSKNVIVCNVFYRNKTFLFPSDLGKYQVTDVLRGLGKLLETYPQVDRRRLYLYGASAGGHLALQVLQCSRQLWAEVFVHCGPTLITTPPDVAALYNNDFLPEGLNGYLRFPDSSDGLTPLQFARYQAERALRSAQKNAAADLPSALTSDYPFIWSMHGTADTTVDIQHLYDMVNVVKSATGINAGPATVLGGQKWALRRWTFITITNGGHGYDQGHSSVDSFSDATNYHVPDAFTRLRPTPPTLTVEYAFPWHHGWRFKISGPLNMATIVTESQMQTFATDWTLYNDSPVL